MASNVYSDLKIFGFPEKIESFRQGRVTAPIYVRIKPINRCNHSCRFCTYSDGTKRKGDREQDHIKSGMHSDMNESDSIPWEKLKQTLKDLRDIGTKAITFSGGGEPLIYSNISDAFQLSLDLGLDLSIITNGQALQGRRAELLTGAKWVRVSIDYTDSKGMVESRNVAESAFDQVMRNMENFAKIKGECDLGVNYIVTRYNYQNLIAFTKRLKEIGVDNVRFSPVYCEGFHEYHKPIKDAVETQLAAIQTFCTDKFTVNSTYVLDHPSKSPERNLPKCLYMQTVPIIGADQNVYTCHNGAFSAKHKIGSIRDQSFIDLWFGEEAKTFFDTFNPMQNCNNMECANHSKVQLFNQLATMSQDNFV